MKNRSILTVIGILIYLVLTITNRFIYKIPDYIYIPISLMELIIIIIGIVRDNKNKGIKNENS